MRFTSSVSLGHCVALTHGCHGLLRLVHRVMRTLLLSTLSLDRNFAYVASLDESVGLDVREDRMCVPNSPEFLAVVTKF